MILLKREYVRKLMELAKFPDLGKEALPQATRSLLLSSTVDLGCKGSRTVLERKKEMKVLLAECLKGTRE